MRLVVGKTPNQFSRYWARKMFSGKGVPPRTFESSEEIIDFVNNNKGAVCYLAENPSIMLKNVKVLVTL